MKFKYAFFLARMNEILGRHVVAARIMDTAVAPSRLQSLKEVYALRLKVLGAPNDAGPSLISSARIGNWTEEVKSVDDEYAALYIDYMREGVNGNVPGRKNIATKLHRLNASDIYRSALVIVD